MEKVGETLEPISPELVLVDPELARTERARLHARDSLEGAADGAKSLLRTRVEAPVYPPAPVADALRPQEAYAGESAPPATSRASPRRLTNTVLTVSLMANALLIAVVVAGSRENQPVSAAPATLRSTTLPTSGDRTTPAPVRSKATQPSAPIEPKAKQTTHTTAGAVERRILAVVIQSPAGKLPPALIDKSTGLAKNNLQAVCHPDSAQSFSCVVRPAQHRPREGLYVRYRPVSNGPGRFTWFTYRRG